jgi:hypothetical protein
MVKGGKHVEDMVRLHGRRGKAYGKQGKAPWQEGESMWKTR